MHYFWSTYQKTKCKIEEEEGKHEKVNAPLGTLSRGARHAATYHDDSNVRQNYAGQKQWFIGVVIHQFEEFDKQRHSCKTQNLAAAGFEIGPPSNLDIGTICASTFFIHDNSRAIQWWFVLEEKNLIAHTHTHIYISSQF